MERVARTLGTGLSAGVVGVVGCGALGAGVAADFTTCPFRLATGLPCPLCGVTHSLLALGSGDFGESLDFSPIGPLTLAAAIAFLAASAFASARSQPVRISRPLAKAVVGIVLVSWVVQLAIRL